MYSRFSVNMISIARKNLFCLFMNPNSFLRNPNVNFLHFFSTSRINRLIPSSEICDVLVNKHQFSPELASLASSRLPKFRSPKRADSVLSFLKEYSFTTAQMEKIVIYDPRILGFNIEGLKFILKVLHDLGLSPEEIAKIMSSKPSIFHSSTKNRIIPRLSMLKGLVGSNQEVARLLKKSAWVLQSDLEKTLMPNVEILKSCGIPMECILRFLYTQPRCFLMKPDIMKKSVDKAIDIGVSRTSTLFIYAAGVLASTSEGMWDIKLQTLRDLGFSDDDIFSMFRKQPNVFSSYIKKMKNVIELVLATGKYNISSIVSCPASLGYSIEKRLEPRLQILGVLESRNLIEKWPALSAVASSTDDNFFDRFIRPYYDEIGEEHITRYMSRAKGTCMKY